MIFMASASTDSKSVAYTHSDYFPTRYQPSIKISDFDDFQKVTIELVKLRENNTQQMPINLKFQEQVTDLLIQLTKFEKSKN